MRCGFTYKAHDADQIGDKDVRRQHSLLQNAFPGAGNNPHAGQLQVQAGSAGKREKTFSGSSEKDGAPPCDNGRWHRDLSQVFQRDTRMHVQAFVSRVVRMPASGFKSPIATSNVKRTRQLLQGRNVGMGGGKHCLFTRAPVSQVAAIFVSCFLSVALHRNELVLVRGTAWESRVLTTRSSAVFGRVHHGHSWQGCSWQEDLTRARDSGANEICSAQCWSGIVATQNPAKLTKLAR